MNHGTVECRTLPLRSRPRGVERVPWDGSVSTSDVVPLSTPPCEAAGPLSVPRLWSADMIVGDVH